MAWAPVPSTEAGVRSGAGAGLRCARTTPMMLPFLYTLTGFWKVAADRAAYPAPVAPRWQRQ